MANDRPTDGSGTILVLIGSSEAILGRDTHSELGKKRRCKFGRANRKPAHPALCGE